MSGPASSPPPSTARIASSRRGSRSDDGHPGGAFEGEPLQPGAGEHEIDLHAGTVGEGEDRPLGEQLIGDIGVAVAQPPGLEGLDDRPQTPPFHLDGDVDVLG